jgi:putative PEP-CTERM system integral membrane protein
MNARLKSLFNVLFSSTFWGWNVIFIIVVYCGILPFIGIPLTVATFDGDVPWDFCLTFVTLIIIPPIFTAIAIKYFSKQPQKLIKVFYGVEAPIFAWCLVRLFLIRELTLASGLVLGTLLLCIAAFGIETLDSDRGHYRLSSWLRMSVHSLMLLMGIYLGLVLLFYALPAAFSLIVGVSYFLVKFFSFEWLGSIHYWLKDSIWFLFIFLLGFILFGFTSTLFVFMPFAVTTLYINSGQKVLRSFAKQHGQIKAIGSAAIVIGLWLILLVSFNIQPQVKAFNLLEKVNPNRQEIIASSETIRKGLINANLYPYRYLSAKEDNNHIFAMYNSLGLPDSAALFLQHRYNQLLSPFLYNGSRGDVQKSEKLYAEFFDTPLQKAERKSVRHALQSTSIVDEAKAGLLNIDQKKVWLEKQEVTLNPHGDWADVEIHEVYNNQTNDVEEILYYFSLPESAAITGLWLGETDNLKQRFPFQVSPRGAAQEVYNSQVQRTRPIDPALLEQVGPGQYRLRAFPVPPRLSNEDIRNGRDRRKMHLWLTYQVMKQDEGWALPKLAEKRNIFWTRFTQRIRNGKTHWFFADTWLEDFWNDNNNPDRKKHQINVNGYTVEAKPSIGQDYVLPNNKKYALILDTSYSMRSHVKEIKATFDWCKKNLTRNDVDFYLTDKSGDRAQRLNSIDNLDIDRIIFYGALQNKDLLQQFQLLRNSKDYDAIFLVTDEGSYELTENKQDIPEIKSSLWMIHLGGKLPKAYDDSTLQAIWNRNGGVANNIATVMKRLATEVTSNVSVVDGYIWTVEKSNSETVTDKSIEPIAARQLVFSLSKKAQNQLSLEDLDTVHQVAKGNNIVTPYSSMIVLVNDEQKELLKQAESKTDRFDRKVETSIEQLEQPLNPFEVSGVPEPDLWLLLVIVILALWLIQKQKIFSESKLISLLIDISSLDKR